MVGADTNKGVASKPIFEQMSADAAHTLGPLLARIDPWARYGYTPEAMTAFLAGREADAVRYAIGIDRALAGAFSIKMNWLRGPYLQFLGILPVYQNQGIGTLVLDWFEQQAREDRAQNLWVAASEFNTRAQSFYQMHGFDRVAVLPDLVADGSAELLLRKQLTKG
ncbi:GNAT family N-acetyltransferase [Hyphomicrobium sp.]|jgi:ribosomal protein S18 acetylase RimI-like enzyme|uniref:GNAT family N-acetyltransferase n=1 Tax=Hyphomicrobium sp. TaxID=82 RepID=UPI002B821F71|nr:GNAT family N-acetyltransferase [Hyphomicrobium sp.]HVZ05345.1 GNAT family N-acetyltransferase [Hyphomicrobium sp.]